MLSGDDSRGRRRVIASFAAVEGCASAFGRVVSHSCRKDRVLMDGGQYEERD